MQGNELSREELLDKYFEKNLSPAEQKAFELLLQNDPDFRDDFEFQKSLTGALKADAHREFRSEMNNWDKPKPKTFPLWWMAALAASIVGILLVVNYLRKETLNPEQIYLSHYEALPNYVMPSVRGGIVESKEQSAFVAYDNKDYALAYQLFNEALAENPTDYLKLYAAVSLMELNRFEEALDLLNDMAEPDTADYLMFSEWFKALCLIRMDEIEEATEMLEKFKTKNTVADSLASALLTDLRNKK